MIKVIMTKVSGSRRNWR